MPKNSDILYEDSDHGLRVTVRTLPGADRGTQVFLAGEIDFSSTALLTETLLRLTALAPVSVLMDLAELTFACSTLANFVVRVRQAVPHGAELILCRPRKATQWVLRVTEMATIATIRDEPSPRPGPGLEVPGDERLGPA